MHTICQHYFLLCCSHRRSTGNPGRGMAQHNRSQKTQKSGGPGGTQFRRTKAPRFQPICLLLEKVTYIDEQNQVQLMIRLSLSGCAFARALNLFTASFSSFNGLQHLPLFRCIRTVLVNFDCRMFIWFLWINPIL